MNIKEVFDKAENGTLTYEQFLSLAGEAKFTDLTEGKYVSNAKYTDEINALNGRINTLNETIGLRDKDLSSLQVQLEAAGTDAQKLTDLTAQFSELQSRYEGETKAYQQQLAEQAYDFAIKEFANSKKFTSNAAKRDFIGAMKAKNLSMENGKIIGADDFVTIYSAENSDAFAVETPAQPEPTPEPAKPHFSAPTGGQPAPAKMSLTELMKAKNDNPEANITF